MSSSLVILRRLSDCCDELKRAAELGRRDPHHPAENLREMTWTRITDFQAHIDQAPRRFADQLLSARDSLARHELQRSHAGRLLEHMRKMRPAQFHQPGKLLNRD